MSKFYCEKNHELKDGKILKALNQAAKDYEDGAIAETKEVLEEIIEAIGDFEYDQG